MTNILKINLFFCFVLVLSCTNSNEQAKKQVPEDKMVSILSDIHVLEAKLEGDNMPQDSLASYLKYYYSSIFEEHGVEEEKFKATLDYYEHHPTKMDELYEKVVGELSKREADLQGADSTAREIVQP